MWSPSDFISNKIFILLSPSYKFGITAIRIEVRLNLYRIRLLNPSSSTNYSSTWILNVIHSALRLKHGAFIARLANVTSALTFEGLKRKKHIYQNSNSRIERALQPDIWLEGANNFKNWVPLKNISLWITRLLETIAFKYFALKESHHLFIYLIYQSSKPFAFHPIRKY